MTSIIKRILHSKAVNVVTAVVGTGVAAGVAEKSGETRSTSYKLEAAAEPIATQIAKEDDHLKSQELLSRREKLLQKAADARRAANTEAGEAAAAAALGLASAIAAVGQGENEKKKTHNR